MECWQAGSTQCSALQRGFAAADGSIAESLTGGEGGQREMASLVPEQLEGVPWMLSPLLGQDPHRKRGCDVCRLLSRYSCPLPAA